MYRRIPIAAIVALTNFILFQKLSTMGKAVAVDQLEQVLKCPVCLEVPSSGDEGRMLLCINGHSICEACYTAMEERTSWRVLEDQSVRLVFAYREKVN